MFYLITIITILFILNNHPLTIGLLLIIIRIIYAVIVALRSTRSWLAYILILVFLRGLIVIIIYITRLASNENIKINWQTLTIRLGAAIILPYLFKIKKKRQIINNQFFFDNNSFTIVYKTYNKLLIEVSLILILYLLVVLIVAIKIVSLKKGPLKINK